MLLLYRTILIYKYKIIYTVYILESYIIASQRATGTCKPCRNHPWSWPKKKQLAVHSVHMHSHRLLSISICLTVGNFRGRWWKGRLRHGEDTAQ